jgi:hypothetical protein
MDARIQAVSIVAAIGLLGVVFELVRRRRFLERYALVWLASGVILLALAIWRGALQTLADAIGVAYPPNALFLIAFGFVLVLLLHFSIAVSKLSDQSKVLAQKVAQLEERITDASRGVGEGAPQSHAHQQRHSGDEQGDERPEEPRVPEDAPERGHALHDR